MCGGGGGMKTVNRFDIIATTYTLCAITSLTRISMRRYNQQFKNAVKHFDTLTIIGCAFFVLVLNI